MINLGIIDPTRGQTIGLFGGSFDPPHEGHLLVSKRVLTRLNLDQLWWIPSQGNPLKSRQPAPMSERIDAITALADHPKMRVYDIEGPLGTRYSIDMIMHLQTRFAGVNFVFICGADILSEFHKWHRWQDMANALPICAVARPNEQAAAMASPFAHQYADALIDEEHAMTLPTHAAPAWTLLHGPMSDASSTKLRAKRALE